VARRARKPRERTVRDAWRRDRTARGYSESKNRNSRPVGRRKSSRPLILIYDNRDRDLLTETDRIIGSRVRASRSVRSCYRSRPAAVWPTDSHETSLALRSSLQACNATIPRDVRRVARVDHARRIACTKKSKGAGSFADEAWSGVTHENAPFIRWRIYAGGRKMTDHGTARPYDEPRARTGSATGAKCLRAIPSQRLHGTSRIRSRTVEPVRDGACQPNNRLG
jgi:hypothetical protein